MQAASLETAPTNKALLGSSGERLGLSLYRKALANLKLFVVGEWPFLLVFCFFFASLVIWACLDHTLPIWDSAFHLIEGYWLRDALIRHECLEIKVPHIISLSPWYPPLFTWVHCLFLLSPMPHAVADNLPRLLFFAIAIVSIYKLGQQLFNDRAIGTLSAAIFCAIPVGYGLAHARGMLDMPLAAMCLLALWLVARWNTTPSLANSIAAGCAIGLACLTKQMGAIYLAPAILIILRQRLLARDFSKVIQLSYGLLLGALMYLGWLLPRFTCIVQQLRADEDSLASQGSGILLWLHNVQFYLVEMAPKCLSIPLTILFIVSLFDFSAQRKLWLPSSFLIGLFILCALRWDTHTFRYAYPTLGYVAISIAALLVRLWRSGSPLLRIFDLTVGLYLAAVYFALNFTPYPLPACPEAEKLGLEFIRSGCIYEIMYPGYPCPFEPLAYNWLLSKIQSKHLGRPSTIEFGVDNYDLSQGSLCYLAIQRDIPLTAISVLGWSMAGFSCTVTSEALNPDWFVTIENETIPTDTHHFLTEGAVIAYKWLLQYFKTTPQYYVLGKFQLQNGKVLVLYRNKNADKSPVLSP